MRIIFAFPENALSIPVFWHLNPRKYHPLFVASRTFRQTDECPITRRHIIERYVRYHVSRDEATGLTPNFPCVRFSASADSNIVQAMPISVSPNRSLGSCLHDGRLEITPRRFKRAPDVARSIFSRSHEGTRRSPMVEAEFCGINPSR